MIVSQGHTIGVAEYLGTDEEGQIVRLAVQDFGHLVRASGPFMQFKQVSFVQFSDLIESNYDLLDARTGEAIRVLRQVHLRNQPPQHALTSPSHVCTAQ
nr:hypothetical protein [uncultured Noviherbaspirillum sp.]